MEWDILNSIWKITTEGNYDNYKKPDGTITADMRETLTGTLEQLTLEDNILDDTEYHRANRRLAGQPIDTTDDKHFTQDEVRQMVEGCKPRKAPDPDVITNEIL